MCVAVKKTCKIFAAIKKKTIFATLFERLIKSKDYDKERIY